MHLSINYHQDPGHGWLEVSRAVIDRLGIAAQISAYSYQNPSTGQCYLEEDCDAVRLMKAIKDGEHTYAVHELHTPRDSFIRNLPQFVA